MKFRLCLQRNYSSCVLCPLKWHIFLLTFTSYVIDPLGICLSSFLEVSLLAGVEMGQSGFWHHHPKGFCEHAAAFAMILNLWHFTLSWVFGRIQKWNKIVDQDSSKKSIVWIYILKSHEAGAGVFWSVKYMWVLWSCGGMSAHLVFLSSQLYWCDFMF